MPGRPRPAPPPSFRQTNRRFGVSNFPYVSNEIYLSNYTVAATFYVCQFSSVRFDDFNGIYVSYYTIAEQRLIKFGNGDKGGCHGGG